MMLETITRDDDMLGTLMSPLFALIDLFLDAPRALIVFVSIAGAVAGLYFVA